MRPHRLAVGLGLLLAVGSPACKDKSDEKKPAPPPPAAVTGLAAVPASAGVVLGVDIEAIADSWLVERAVGQMFLRDPGLEARVAQLITGCRFDPAKDLRSLVIALGSGEDEDQALMVATGRFSEPEVAACVEKSLAEDGGSLTRSEVGGRRFYRTSGRDARDEGVWFTFGNPETLIAATSSEWLSAATGDGPKVTSVEPMATWIERARSGAGSADEADEADEAGSAGSAGSADIWAAGTIDENIGADMVELTGGKISAPPRALLARVGLRDGLDVTLAAVTASEEDAEALVAQASAQLTVGALALQSYGLGPVVSRLQVSAEGDTARLKLVLGQEELKDLLSRIDTTPAPAQDTPSGSSPSGDPQVEPGATPPAASGAGQ